MADQKSLGVLALVGVLVAAGGCFFLFQQYSERAAAQNQANAVRDERVRLVSDYGRVCSDMAASATVMTREVRRYLNNLNNPKVSVSGKVVTDSMEKFVLQLVTLQGIGGDLASTVDLTFESCPTPKSGGSSFRPASRRPSRERNAKSNSAIRCASRCPASRSKRVMVDSHAGSAIISA